MPTDNIYQSKKPICRFCNCQFPKKKINKHELWCDLNPNLNKVKEFFKDNPNRMINHFSKAELLGLEKPKVSDETKEKLKLFSNKHTEETKLKLSISRKKYLKDNPDKHPWKNKNKQISIPCEYLKNIFKEKNISFIEEYSPLKGYNYSLDIAFPDVKIAIEVNGNFHYKNLQTLELTDYYKKRENEFINNGWKLIQVHYSLVYNSNFTEELLINLDLKEFSDYSKYYTPKTPKITESEKEFNQFIKKEKEINKEINKQLKRIAILKNSSIDFSKFGWCEKASELINISPQKIRPIIKKYDLNFYNTMYKRSTPQRNRTSRQSTQL